MASNVKGRGGHFLAVLIFPEVLLLNSAYCTAAWVETYHEDRSAEHLGYCSAGSRH